MRNWGLLSGIAAHHEVSLLSFAEQGQHVHPTLAQACVEVGTVQVPARTRRQRVMTLATSSIPDMGWRLWSVDYARLLNEWLQAKAFDIVQVEGIELARYAVQAAANAHQPKWVFDDHNCEYVLQQRNHERDRRAVKRWHASAYSLVQWRRLKVFERAAMRAAQATLCVSPEDRDALVRLDPAQRPVVIPNGIDVASYATFQPALAGSDADAAGPVLVFSGKMDYRPNIEAALWFGERVLPLIKRAVPDVRWLLVGQKPDARLDVLRSDPAITVTGAVDDIRDYIGRASVYVAPLLAGGGTRFKLLEAMSMRKPIVSTTVGAEGFAAVTGRELMLADSADSFAAAVVDLLANGQARAALSGRGYDLVRTMFDWRVIVPRLEAVYAGL